MPPIQQGNITFKRTTFRPRTGYDYDYPDGLDLKPGSKLHSHIRDMVMEYAFFSSREMSSRHEAWNRIDKTLTAYIPLDDEERGVKDEDSRKPVSIVFPNSYAVLETLLSYFTGAFFQDPIFRYVGTGPDDVIGAVLLEKVIEQQCYMNKVALNIHTQARDAFCYGFGVSTPTWIEERGRKRIKRQVPGIFNIFTKTEYEVLEDQVLFEGNALNNIDPYKYLPDTNVPIHMPQDGEFVGWIESDNYMDMLGEERKSNDVFNVRYLKELLGRRSSIYSGDTSARNIRSGVSNPGEGIENSQSKAITKVNMFVKLIPKDEGLGDGKYPEVWFFQICQDEIVTQAFPLNLDHNRIPISVMAPDYDGYSNTPISRIEMLYGMQEVLDFMFNSHVANVRKAINDTIIYDPYQVNSADFKTSEPGKHIRLRRPAWGRGVKDVVQQLAVTDVTRGNVVDSNFLVQAMNRIGATDENLQGSLRQGGPDRLTGMEYQGTRAGGISRIEHIVKVMGMQGMQDIGFMFAAHNKQFMSEDVFIQVYGDWKEVLLNEYKFNRLKINRGRIAVSPRNVDVFNNIKIRDGSVPGGNFSNHWIQLFQILGSNPQLAQEFDVVRIFKHIARNLGAKNINEFVKSGGNINADVQSDQQIQDQVQKGNIIPLQEAV